MADPRFIGLVHSLRSSAEAALGEMASPMVTRLARDGALARTTALRSLDLLEMLVDKTLGRLDATEREALMTARDAVRARLTATEDPEAAPAGEPRPGTS
jgi:3-hydroxyisobutyrate dehydrogenase-like beta-hydroxyacid dehydrogenase